MQRRAEVNKTELEQLADLRLAEAVALLGLTPPMPDGAYYLAGYAVECALKACIAKLTAQHDFPDKNFAAKCFTHKAKNWCRLRDWKASGLRRWPPTRSWPRTG